MSDMPRLTESTAARHPGFCAMTNGSSLRSGPRLPQAHPAARLSFWVLSERDNNYGVDGWADCNPPRGGTPHGQASVAVACTAVPHEPASQT